MTKEQYLKLFQSPYNQPDWELFLKELLPGTTVFPIVRELKSSHESVIQIIEFGEFYTPIPEKKKISLFAVQLKDKKIARNRVGLNKIIAAELSPGITDAALVVFYDTEQPEWRFSFLARANVKGRGTIETSFQRFTYVFGTQETHQTARSRMDLLFGSNKKLEHFQEAFNVEQLNTRFFNEYKIRYEAFCNDLIAQPKLHKSVFGIEYPEKSEKKEIEALQKPIRDFVKLMLGRIMFIYFLQKKGWMGCPAPEQGSALPCDEKGDWKNGDPNFLQNLFEQKAELQTNFYSKVLTELFFNTLNNPDRPGCLFPLTGTRVPYLNGGLFHDAHPHTNGIDFDPLLFRQLFSFLAEFNFTIYEDSPDDQEVGIDPEMLGRIFESLLEANKEFGTFYTPKPVVHYMCQESLLSYLKHHLLGDTQAQGLGSEALEDLVRLHDRPEGKDKAEFIRQKAKDIERLLERITICDPAVGSGAFPMGMMQEMLYIRQALDWTLDNAGEIKKSILQNNIYGVDLDGGAVEIARLRFWLSLVVDENQPQPLPNLDYKIMQGNSLLESFEGISLDVLEDSEEINDTKSHEIKNGQLDIHGKPKDGQLALFSSKPKVENTLKKEEVKKLKKLVDQFFSIGSKVEAGKNTIKEKEETKARIDGIISNAIKRRIKEHKDDLEEIQKHRMANRILLENQAKQANLSPAVKAKVQKAREKFEKEETAWLKKYEEEIRKEDRLAATLSVAEKPYYLWHLYFGSVFEQGGFDLVIGNPPYGGSPIPDMLEKELELGSKDVYGAFMSFCLHSAGKQENGKVKEALLKPSGLLAFIVSDTFMTIKTHKPLRQQMMQHRLLKMVRMHPKTFKATVNTAIVLAQRNGHAQTYKVLDSGNKDSDIKPYRFSGNNLQMVDLTTVNPHDEYELFRRVLGLTYQSGQVSNSRYAIYQYPQTLIATNSNLPFFVASPKLFALMNDQTAETAERELNGKKLKVRKVKLNDKEVELVKLGEIAEVKVGLQTGDNDAYLFQNPEARGNYRSINDYKNFLLTEADLEKIRKNESLRLEVIEKGISKDDPQSKRYFGGKYIIPHDKGGESDSDEGWLPNYMVPTNYFIDWSEWALVRIKSLVGVDGKLKSRFQNTGYYFLKGIDYSQTGIYCPTFRINSGGNFNTEATSIFGNFEPEELLGKLCSKLYRKMIKVFIDNTVHASADKVKESIIRPDAIAGLKSLVISIISNQAIKSDYDYASHEQIEIDRLVYEAYCLNEDDIREVECWYARRYPKLAEAQLRNLKNLGKTKDYEYFKQYWQSDPMLQSVAVSLPEQEEKTNWLAEISTGESKALEFKSTLVWDVKEGKKNPAMEHSVLKTLAAFMNSEGGVLYIGVTDEKEIFGIEADMKALGKGNADGVLLHLDNLIKNSLGVANQQYLSHAVGTLEGKTIIRFEAKPAQKEVWLTFDKKDGKGKQEEFYIRSQASSVALQGKELSSYIKGRF